MSIDRSTHSLFGVSKAAADLLVQEYGRYFDMPTVCFRGGCLTGPNHAGAQLHGFLSYLMRCTITGDPYTVFGYGGKQVRDNIHAADLVAAFEAFHAAPKPAAVYNIGGGRESNCSMLEAIALCEQIAGRELSWELSDQNRDRATTGGGSPTSGRSRPTIPGGGSPTTSRRSCARSTTTTSSSGSRPHERSSPPDTVSEPLKLSVVIPAHNEVDSIAETVTRTTAELRAAGIDYEIVVVDDASRGRHGGRGRPRSAPRTPGFGACARRCPRASATPCGRAFRSTPATPWRS